MSEELMQVYQKTVLEHSRNPHHFGALEGATRKAEGFNPLCGDKITIYLSTSTDGQQITEASHETSGCAICMSSASMMADAVQTLSAAAATSLCAQLEALLNGNSATDTGPGMPLESLAGVRAYPTRVKCATLPWRTLMAALSGETKATTEHSN
jgi:nitrogen fixation protein NifU and related proteins